ncbi:MAG: lipopolysaccharide biosynthesis protein [Amphiplicatus sp.]
MNEETGRGVRTGDLSARAARGAAWMLAARAVMRALGFVSTIVLARLLAPDDFGLVAVAVTAMQLLQGLTDIGASQAVVRFRDADRADLDTLFTLSAIRGAATTALLFAAAPLSAAFYQDPRMFWVFAGLAPYPFITGLINPKFHEFERDLDFSKEFISAAANKFIGVAISIAIALLYGSYLAIIIGLVASGLAQLAISYAMRPYLPRPTFQSFRKVLGFSGWLAGVSFVAALNNKLDAFVLARAVGPAGTGAYYIGMQLGETPTMEIAAPIARAIYPGLSALQGELARMRAAYLRGVAALGAVAMPAAIGFALVAYDLAPLLLGEKWAAAVPVIETIAPVLGLQTLFVATQYYAMALGLTRLVFIRELIFLTIRLPVFVWASMRYGLDGAVLAAAGSGLVHVGLNLGLYARASGRPAYEPLWSARRSLVSVAAMAAFLIFMRPSYGLVEGAAALAADILSGAALYVATHLVLWRIEGRPNGVEKEAFSFLQSGFARARRA